jgi:uncharacterized protein YecA (UPF0149 family)
MESEGEFRMIISEKQQAANRQNAQQSTGPKTAEGKTAVRFNALTWGLRARSLMLPRDIPEEYQQLWDGLAAEWQPQTDTERHYLEQMAISEWLLARTADSEYRVYEASLPLKEELALLDRVSVRRVRLEHSFTAGMEKLKQLRKERQAQPQPQPAQAAKAAPEPPHKPAEPQAPPPDYKMSEGQAAHPVSCAPVTPDTR